VEGGANASSKSTGDSDNLGESTGEIYPVLSPALITMDDAANKIISFCEEFILNILLL